MKNEIRMKLILQQASVQRIHDCMVIKSLVHLMFRGPCIIYSDIYTTRCNVTHFIYIWKLLSMFQVVSPPIIRSTQLYLQCLVLVKPLLLPAAIVEELEWEVAVTGLTSTRCCRYSCVCS